MTRDKHDIEKFESKLQVLCAFTLADNRDQGAAAVMIESLLSSLAFTIAIACGGNPKAIDEMLHGANAYLIERCADHRRAGSVIGHIMKEQS